MVQLNKRIFGNYWDSITKAGPDVCFVCGKPLFPKRRSTTKQALKGMNMPRSIGNHKITGEELWRHANCEPGSPNWMKKFNGYAALMSKVKKKEEL
jgi:hypothetical protein